MRQNGTSIQLRAATGADLRIAASWITSARECEQWTGPRVGFPVDVDALLRTIDFSSGSSFALADPFQLIGFGQLLRKASARGHLARLIVNPARRGEGLGEFLVRRLLATARDASFHRVSLNVAEGNGRALSLYTKLGFRDAARPADEPAVSGARYCETSVLDFSSSDRCD
jgi:ribosomal protein S18 acetylase RimI-like enzyme